MPNNRQDEDLLVAQTVYVQDVRKHQEELLREEKERLDALFSGEAPKLSETLPRAWDNNNNGNSNSNSSSSNNSNNCNANPLLAYNKVTANSGYYPTLGETYSSSTVGIGSKASNNSNSNSNDNSNGNSNSNSSLGPVLVEKPKVKVEGGWARGVSSDSMYGAIGGGTIEDKGSNSKGKGNQNKGNKRNKGTALFSFG